MKSSFLYLLISLPVLLCGQNSFFKSYGGPGNDFGESVITSTDSCYVAIGASESFGNGATDLYAFKVDTGGSYIWSKTFGCPNIDYGTDLVELNDGSIILAGYSNSFSNGYDLFLVKIQENGNHLWTKTIGGNDWDFCFAAHQTIHSTTGVVLAGETYSYGNGNGDAFLVKINTNGDTLWTKTFGGNENDRFNDVIEDENGNIICIGTTNSNTLYEDNDIWIVKTDSSGNLLWDYVHSDTLDDQGISICLSKNGYYIFNGNDEQTSRVAPYYACLDSLGNLVFEENFSGTLDDFSACVIRHSDSTTYTFVGNTYSFGANNATSDVLYSQIYVTFTIGPLLGTSGTAYQEWVNGADTTADHSIIIVGTTDGTINGQNSVFLMKKDQNYNSPSYAEELDLSVHELNSTKFSIYPNPVQSDLFIPKNRNFTEIYIYDINGRKILTLHPRENKINLQQLKAGIYFLRTNSNGSVSQKFIKL